ncbi:DUF2911 domain-containing protein [Chondrinema litorale]|uniref:DUF2911 domain-containing protein n=1 Tax=Chondrinema litorale TaxID=2994555 RepID=UPI0025436CCE|nr:DUF2911 domain-containing protein [Chondrinema litorale]UZR96040.1 DUF2911 domain-containing protein [Chondrinema litorale]
MKRSKLLFTLTVFVFSAITTNLFAQMQRPAPSPAASVSQVVGFTKITIDYSSPAVKGRKVFGELEPYGKTWRAGANGATTINFSTGVKIGDQTLRPGTYSIFITPQESGPWTVHFNKDAKAVFAYMADGKIDEAALAKDDAVAVKVEPAVLDHSMERLMYMISAEDNKTAKVIMVWDKTMISVDVDTMVDDTLKSIEGIFK